MRDQEEKQLDRLENNLDNIKDRLASVDTTLKVQAEQLGQHMRRTELLEKRVDQIEPKVAEIRTGLKNLVMAGMAVGGVTTTVSVLLELAHVLHWII